MDQPIMNRRLVRPNLSQMREKARQPASSGSAPARERNQGQGQGPRRRVAPPDGTAAEAFYYLKQMNNETPMVVVLDNEEQIRGHIEWYDKNCLKVNRDDAPNLLLFKRSIKYMYKAEEES